MNIVFLVIPVNTVFPVNTVIHAIVFFFFSECSDSSEYSVSSKYSDSCSQKHDNLLRMRYGSALIGNGRRGHVHKRGCHAV